MNRQNMRHTRSFLGQLETRTEAEEKVIEGYFAVFNRQTELWPGAFEQIAPGAFDGTLENDIRALINHDANMVLGRNKAGTLALEVDSYGLKGVIKINENDIDALNLYERVKRGDVNQCSFGFNILKEDTDYRDDGSVLWTIRQIDLHEVSVCTFPAYEQTGVQARQQEVKQHKERQLEAWRAQMKARLQNVKTDNAE